ncbi:MAG: hypothetical protein WBC78_08675 [Candidatus Sulfotelmatobacter sp.]
MVFCTGKTLARILFACLIACAFAHALCSVDTVVVRGQVNHAPRNAKVRVQLIFSKEHAKEQLGDSGETTIENDTFSVPIEFLTQSHKPVLMGMGEKCGRKPKTVVITLVEGDQEYDHVSLDFAKDFQIADPTAYTLRSKLVLNGPQ